VVKTPPIPRYGGREAGTIRLVQQRLNRPGDEFEAPRDREPERGKWEIAFLDPNRLSASIANRVPTDSPILKVEAVSFFLGATNTSKPRRPRMWEYRPQLVFLNATEAREAMDAAYSASRHVLVLSLPALIVHMEYAVLLVAQLNTNEPFRHVFDRLKPTYAGRPTRRTRAVHLQSGPFHPKTLRDAVDFFLIGAAASAKKSWLFSLMLPPGGHVPGRAFPPPALAYTMDIRSYAKKPGSRLAAKVKLADIRWTRHALGAQDAPMDTYARRLLALTFL
jgi:hypothetical protein